MLARRSEARMGFMRAGGSFRLQKREGVGYGWRSLRPPFERRVVLFNFFQVHDVHQERPELVPPPDKCKIIKKGLSLVIYDFETAP